MARKQRTRRLWLEIKYRTPGVSKKEVKEKLLRSINNGTYRYPLQWKVVIGWSNKEFDDLKWGEFTAEMKASRKSSPGFDAAVISYLEKSF